jgi:hypothetical protein
MNVQYCDLLCYELFFVCMCYLIIFQQPAVQQKKHALTHTHKINIETGGDMDGSNMILKQYTWKTGNAIR